MKITIQSTATIVRIEGTDVACRLFEGTTERGETILCLIPNVFETGLMQSLRVGDAKLESGPRLVDEGVGDFLKRLKAADDRVYVSKPGPSRWPKYDEDGKLI